MLKMGSHSCQQTCGNRRAPAAAPAWQLEQRVMAKTCKTLELAAVTGSPSTSWGDPCPGRSLQAGSLAKAHVPQHRGSLGVCGGVATLELVHIKLALAAGVVHVANLPEDGPLRPALVVNATDGPQAACQAQGQSVSSPLAGGTQRASGMWVQSKMGWSCLQRAG